MPTPNENIVDSANSAVKALEEGIAAIAKQSASATPETTARITMNFIDRRCNHLAVANPANMPKEIGGVPCHYDWSDLIRVGDFTHPITGARILVTPARLQHWDESGNAMLSSGVGIPVNVEHGLGAHASRGNVVQFRIDGDRLQGLLQMIGDDAQVLLARNKISVGIDPQDYPDGTGRVWHDVIYHVSITQFPVVSNLNPAQLIAASRTSTPGSEIFFDVGESPATAPAVTTSIKEPKMATSLSDGNVAALRKEPHLSMADVPDDGIGEHLSKFHAKLGQHLSSMCSAMPGGGSCPADEAIPRATGYMSAMSGLVPKHLMSAKPEEIRTAMEERIALLSKAAPEIDGLKVANEDLKKQNLELSRQIPKTPFADADAEADGIESANAVYNQLLVGENAWPSHIVEQLKKIFVSRDGAHANNTCLSRTANPGGSKAITYEALQVFMNLKESGWAPKGERTRTQTLSRQIPGKTGPTDEDNRVAEKFMELGRMPTAAELATK